MKKLLLLGGDASIVPVIKAAKARGYYVITCDYLPDNIAHKYSDEYINHSTTDKEDILNWAEKNNIDGVLTFTDSGVITAAYISEHLNLVKLGSFESIEIMQNKDKFRKFLKRNNLNVPNFAKYSDWSDIEKNITAFNYPVMIKPVDAAGSKGVTKICSKDNLKKGYDDAVSFSSRKSVIIEEFIEPEGPQIHGDCFVKDGKIEFIYLGDHHFDNTINNLVPISTTWPSIHSNEDLSKVEYQLQTFITKVGFKNGCVNVECRINKSNGQAYLIDVGARSGGNFTPFVICYASGFSFVNAMLDYTIEHRIPTQKINKKGYYAYLIIHSKEDGILKEIIVNDSLTPYIIERHDYVPIGKSVRSFRGANAAVGIIIAKFDSMETMQFVSNNLDNYINVEVIKR